MSQGYSRRQAMLHAGYKLSTANQSIRVMRTNSMINLVESFQDKLAKAGITTDYIAAKIAEWMEATKIVNGNEVPAYDTQLKAYSIVVTIMKETEKMQDGKPKPKLSIEEFLNM